MSRLGSPVTAGLPLATSALVAGILLLAVSAWTVGAAGSAGGDRGFAAGLVVASSASLAMVSLLSLMEGLRGPGPMESIVREPLAYRAEALLLMAVSAAAWFWVIVETAVAAYPK